MTIKQLQKEIEELKAMQIKMQARLDAIEVNDPSLCMAADRRLQIRMIAQARRMGDKGPLKEWNRQRKREFELHGK